MKVQNIDKQNNISMRALYFPSKPESMTFITPKIEQAIINNKFISVLAQENDVFVRFIPKNEKFNFHMLSIDIVDLPEKLHKKSILFSSRIYGGVTDISAIDFINKIRKPLDNVKQNFFSRLFYGKKNPNQTEFFNYQELSPLVDDEYLLDKGMLSVNESLKLAELKRRTIDMEIMKRIDL